MPASRPMPSILIIIAASGLGCPAKALQTVLPASLFLRAVAFSLPQPPSFSVTIEMTTG